MSRLAVADDIRRRILLGYCGVTLAPTVLLLAFLIGSVLLSGAQVVPESGPYYAALLPFPFFVVSDPFAAGLALIGILLVIPLVVSTASDRARSLLGPLAYTVAALASNAFYFVAFSGFSAFSDPPTPGNPLNGYIFAIVLSAFCAVVLLVRVLTAQRRHDPIAAS